MLYYCTLILYYINTIICTILYYTNANTNTILILYYINIIRITIASQWRRNGCTMGSQRKHCSRVPGAQLETPTDPWNRNHFGDAWESQWIDNGIAMEAQWHPNGIAMESQWLHWMASPHPRCTTHGSHTPILTPWQQYGNNGCLTL